MEKLPVEILTKIIDCKDHMPLLIELFTPHHSVRQNRFLTQREPL